LRRLLICFLLLILLSIGLVPFSSPVQANHPSVNATVTVALTISDVSVSNIGYHSATITWKTNGAATSQVYYDTVSHENITAYTYNTTEYSELVPEHSISLTGLSSGTTYHFRVRSVADGIEAISSDYVFSTRSPAAPPAPVPTHYYLNINFFGETSKWRTSYDGCLLGTVDITSQDGKINIYVPKDTLCTDKEGKRLKELLIAREEEASPPPANTTLIGQAYDISPDGATFDPYLKLTLAYEEEDTPEGIKEENLYIAYYNTEWVPLESIVDAEENKISAELTHLTIFAIMAQLPPTPPPAEFELSNLNITPTEVKPGKEVTISVEVTNIGGREGRRTVSLRVNQVLEQTKQITLAPGQTEVVTFAVTRDEPGSYTVEVNGLTKGFTVVAPSWLSKYWWITMAVLVAIGLLIYFLSRRKRGLWSTSQLCQLFQPQTKFLR